MFAFCIKGSDNLIDSYRNLYIDERWDHSLSFICSLEAICKQTEHLVAM